MRHGTGSHAVRYTHTHKHIHTHTLRRRETWEARKRDARKHAVRYMWRMRKREAAAKVECVLYVQNVFSKDGAQARYRLHLAHEKSARLRRRGVCVYACWCVCLLCVLCVPHTEILGSNFCQACCNVQCGVHSIKGRL
jgi:hypothetical protein